MSFELDIHAVGQGQSSGDAITLRFGELGTPHQKVVVVDGGYQADGEALVDFIPRVYGTRTIDLMISTHPHSDHVGGLRPLLESLDVRELWMHRPWTRSHSIHTYITDGRVTHRSLTDRLQQSFRQAHELEQLAIEKRVVVREPFAGVMLGNEIIVAGPTEDYYASLMASFDDDQRAASLGETLMRGVRAAVRRLVESWDDEALVEPDEDAVSPVNNSSAILYLNLEELILLTADAGVPALRRALDVLTLAQLSTDFRWFQLPHHGSKRNLGPSILNRLLGRPFGAESNKWGIVSAATDGRPKHPSQRVINAVRRRGAKVQSTSGQNILLQSDDALPRPGYHPLATLEFVSEYED
ncbi:MAG: MBL fold metallo-hydrolase [Bacteroidetes bacterium SB0662_bin_6]|nr:MBL fold metallo-hydrolase [Bacteroidetes bacterium SB0662_bin_6]